MTRAARLAALLMVAAGSARADPDYMNLHAVGSVLMSLDYAKVTAPSHVSALSHEAAVGLGGTGLIGSGTGWAAGFQLALGGGVRGGFLYGFDLRLAGLGMRVGRTGMFAVSAGGGLGGVTARVPFSWTVPVEARLELDAGKARVVAFYDAVWTLTHARRGGTGAPLGDELSAGLGLRLGRLVDFGGMGAVGDGTYLGLSYAEQLGTRFIGAVFGYGMSAAH